MATDVPTGVAPEDTTRVPRGVGGQVVGAVYRPAAAIRLTIRLEDWSNVDGPQAQQEAKPAKTQSARAIGQAASLRALQAVRRASGEFDANLDAQVLIADSKAKRVKAGQTTATGAAPPGGAGRDDHSIELGIVPLDLNVSLNGFRTADKVAFEMALADLPIPPDIVRSMLVEVFMGEVTVDDLGDPTRWLPRLYQAPPMFRGYAEDETLEADENDLKIVVNALSLEQRLMTLKINPFTKERAIAKGGEPVTAYVQRLVSTIPEFNGTYGAAIGVRMFPNVDPAKVPRLDAKMFKRSLQTAASRAQGGGQIQGAPPPGTDPAMDPSNGQPAGVGFPAASPAVADVSVWDVIVRAAELAGVIPIYDPSIVAVENGQTIPLGANNILLVPPQNIKETPQDGITIPGGPIDGFSRELTLGGTSTIRTQVRFMVWGQNIKSMHVTRKYGREKAPGVRVLCHNPDAAPGKRILQSVFPKTLRGTSVSAVGSVGQGKGHAPIEAEVVRIVREIRRQEDLDRIAVALYHSIGRRKDSVTIETNELSSYYDPNNPTSRNPDLLRLRPGTPCRVMVARAVQDPAGENFVVNGLSELMDRRANPAFLRKALLERPSSPAVIATEGRAQLEEALGRIEASFQSSRLTDWFYCRTVEIRWNSDDGFSCTIELANFVEARSLPANLGGDDKKLNDLMKAAVPAAPPDPRADAIAANLDDILTKMGGGQ